MTLDEWIAEIRDAFAADGQRLPAQGAATLSAGVPAQPTQEQVKLASDAREIITRLIFKRAEVRETFGDPARIASRFGQSLETNYRLSSGPFLDLARAHWTFKLEVEDLFPHHSNTFAFAVLSRVEQDVASVFFPTPGPARVSVEERREAQRRLLREFAPHLDAERFLQESPILKAEARTSGGCFGTLLLIASLIADTLFMALIFIF